MNLHNLACRYIAPVNPPIWATFKPSQGTATPPGTFKPVPQYGDPVQIRVQIQALQYNDIAQIDGMNIQGTRRKIYVNGAWNGVSRSDNEGGDILQFPEHPGGPVKTWLVVFVFEQWPDWCSLCVTLQADTQ